MQTDAILAAAPAQFWWAAPTATVLAVGVAFGVSVRSLKAQRQALEDNRRLRIADDVRDVLAETLRDLYRLRHAIERAGGIISLNKARSRQYRQLEVRELEPSRIDAIRNEINAIERDLEDRILACTQAGADVELGGERLKLLLGDDHKISKLIEPLDVPTFDFLRRLPVHAANGVATKALSDELGLCSDYVWNLIPVLSAAGHNYVRELQNEAPGRPFALD